MQWPPRPQICYSCSQGSFKTLYLAQTSMMKLLTYQVKQQAGHSTASGCHFMVHSFDPVHIPTSNFLKIHLNIILPSMPWSPNLSLFLRFPHQNLVYTSPLVLHALPISFFSMLSSKQQWVSSADTTLITVL